MLIKDFGNIELKGSDGKSYKLSKFRGKYIVLYFYPKDNTPGCSMQGSEYTKLLSDFKKNGAVVFGVSKGTLESKKGFCDAKNFKHILLADVKGELAEAFYVKNDLNPLSSVVNKICGSKKDPKDSFSIKRSSFIISPSGSVISERVGVSPWGDALENLNFLLKIQEEN